MRPSFWTFSVNMNGGLAVAALDTTGAAPRSTEDVEADEMELEAEAAAATVDAAMAVEEPTGAKKEVIWPA
jgi:hypothetical protein